MSTKRLADSFGATRIRATDPRCKLHPIATIIGGGHLDLRKCHGKGKQLPEHLDAGRMWNGAVMGRIAGGRTVMQSKCRCLVREDDTERGGELARI